MKILFLVNPISGGVDKEPFLKEASDLCKKYGIDYQVFKTTGKDDKTNVLKILTAYHPDKVVSVGGDGTTLFTALALLDSNYPMGIIPLGSANGMAKELFVNDNPIESFKDILLSEQIHGLDLLKINGEHYTMHIGDVGINAQIVQSYEKDPKRGMVTYAKYFLEQLKILKPFPVKVTANGEVNEKKVYMLGICNARKYGTGVPLNLNGNPMDGKFELVLLSKIDTVSLIKAGLSSFDESFYDHQTSEVIVTEKAVVEFENPKLLQLDGEVIGEVERIDIEILPGAVKFITHGDNEYIDVH